MRVTAFCSMTLLLHIPLLLCIFLRVLHKSEIDEESQPCPTKIALLNYDSGSQWMDFSFCFKQILLGCPLICNRFFVSISLYLSRTAAL